MIHLPYYRQGWTCLRIICTRESLSVAKEVGKHNISWLEVSNTEQNDSKLLFLFRNVLQKSLFKDSLARRTILIYAMCEYFVWVQVYKILLIKEWSVEVAVFQHNKWIDWHWQRVRAISMSSSGLFDEKAMHIWSKNKVSTLFISGQIHILSILVATVNSTLFQLYCI